MKVIIKKYYRFDKEEKKRFKKFLIDSGLKSYQFAEKCGVSMSYLTFIINGERNITPKLKKIFEENGYEVNENE